MAAGARIKTAATEPLLASCIYVQPNYCSFEIRSDYEGSIQKHVRKNTECGRSIRTKQQPQRGRGQEQ